MSVRTMDADALTATMNNPVLSAVSGGINVFNRIADGIRNIAKSKTVAKIEKGIGTAMQVDGFVGLFGRTALGIYLAYKLKDPNIYHTIAGFGAFFTNTFGSLSEISLGSALKEKANKRLEAYNRLDRLKETEIKKALDSGGRY